MNELLIDNIIIKLQPYLTISEVDRNTFLTHEKNIDFILETIFEHCINETHCCFHIDRHLNKQCNVTIFTDDTENLTMIFRYI
ncbi:MAG: hypothetical protein WHU93_05985, partial [Arcobacteraceae bacterium]